MHCARTGVGAEIILPCPIAGQLRSPQLNLRGGHAVLLGQGAGPVLQGLVGVQKGVQGLRRLWDSLHSPEAGAPGLRREGGGHREEEELRQREGQFCHGDGPGKGSSLI